MRIILRRKERSRDMYASMHERLHSELADGESELRKLFARVARSESRDFFALHIGTELEKFERELQQRAERVLANLGSAAPALTAEQRSVADAAIEKAVRRLHKIPDNEPLPLCLTDVCPNRFATCKDCTIPNKENL